MTGSFVDIKTDPVLYIPIFDRLCCCLPKSVIDIGKVYKICTGWTTGNHLVITLLVRVLACGCDELLIGSLQVLKTDFYL